MTNTPTPGWTYPEMPPQDEVVLMRRRGSEQIPRYEWRALKDELPEQLVEAWGRYCAAFGAAPHGTLKQMRALLEFLPKERPAGAETSPSVAKIDLAPRVGGGKK